MDRNKFRVQKDILLRFLEGHRKANELISEEKKKRLYKLTVKDSLQEYDALYNMWKISTNKKNLERLERQKIKFLLERRKQFNKASGFKNNNESTI